MLVDLFIGCLVFAVILLPQYCFKNKYQKDYELMKAADEHFDATEVSFSNEEIRELRKL